jgi:putative holliday junction resolvase
VTRILAFDHGTRRIGVAVTDPDGVIAHPRPALDAGAPDLLDEVRNLAATLGVAEIVVGLPVGLDGTEGPAAAAARQFAADVEEATGVHTVMYDERFSSVIAERSLLEMGERRKSRRHRRDGVAAMLFLQDYLESRR